MLLSIKDQYIKQGYQRGFEQGFEQGIEQGIEQRTKKSILQALQLRFSYVPTLFQKYIRLIHGKDTLELLFKNAILCQSLEEFEEKLP